MRWFRRKPRISLDQQIQAEVDRTGTRVAYYYANAAGEWRARWDGADGYLPCESEIQAKRTLLFLLREMPAEAHRVVAWEKRTDETA